MLKVFAMRTAGMDKHDAARLLLRWKFEDIFEEEMPEIFVTEMGKPFFRGDTYHFSISYTAEYCFVAICDCPVGMDAEKIRSVSANAVAGILSPNEWKQYSLAKDPAETFMRFWTLKEAYCKFTGLGIAKTKLRETEFDLSRLSPVLPGKETLLFWCRRLDGDLHDVVISLCSDATHRPEFYLVEI